MSEKYRAQRRMSRQVHKSEATREGASYVRVSVPDGSESGDVAIEIDIDALFSKLGRKALENRTRRAVALNGAIRVQVYNVTRDR